MALKISSLQEQDFRESIAINKSQSSNKELLQQKKQVEHHEKPTLPEIENHLEEILKETKITYSIDEHENGFIIKVMDKKTDKIIKEIPSHDIQVLRKHFKDHLGVLFNELI